jgi:cytochrome c553
MRRGRRRRCTPNLPPPRPDTTFVTNRAIRASKHPQFAYPSKEPDPMNRILALALGAACLAGLARAHAADAPAAPAADAKKIDWEHASVAEKKKYMKTVVLPTMKKEFIGFDAKKYSKMNCATCHGDGVDDGKFKMPNPKLPKLPKPTAQSDFVELQKKKPEAVKFMGTVVKPKMAELLGLPQWSPDHKNGFGCYHCHTKEGE